MSDYRMELINRIEETLIKTLSREETLAMSDRIIKILNDYEITERCTDVVVYDDMNHRILKRYLACLSVDGKSEKTIAQYRRSVTKMLEFIGKPVAEIGVYDIRYYLACEKERGISNRSIENTRANLSAFFQWLTQEEMIQKNPCLNIKPIKYVEEIKKPFTDVEIDRLRSACKTSRERAFVEVLLTSGVRVSELSNMNVSDVDFNTLTLYVRNGKGGKDRITYINDVARTHLQKYLMERTERGDALFYNKNHDRINPGGIRCVLNSIAKRVNVDSVHPHKFRRTFATGLANRGMSIQEIQVLLGHSSVETTLEYVCVSEAKTKDSYKRYIA